MRRHVTIILCVLFSALCLCLWGSPPAGASTSGAVSVRDATVALRRAEARVHEARLVLYWTKKGSAQYGASVGRWVSLARKHDWPWARMAWLLHHVYCESHGIPDAVNPSSGAAGLLQLMPFWANGETASFWARWHLKPIWTRTNASQNLKYARHLSPSNWSY